MPDPITSLKNLITNPAGGTSGVPYGSQDMPGSSPKPWADYPIEGLLGAVGVGRDTQANRYGQVLGAALPVLGGAAGAFRSALGEAPEAISGLSSAFDSLSDAGPTAAKAFTSSAPPNPFTQSGGSTPWAATSHYPGGPSTNLHDVAAGTVKPYPIPTTRLSPGEQTGMTNLSDLLDRTGNGNPNPGGMGTYPSSPMPTPTAPMNIHEPPVSIPGVQPYGAVPAYDWPGMDDGSGSSQQYNITGGPPPPSMRNSSVGQAKLKSMGIPIPFGPPPR